MSNIIGNYKEYVIIEREALKLLEEKIHNDLATAQDDHNVEDIRKAKVWMKAIEWMKANNIYNNEFKIKP